MPSSSSGRAHWLSTAHANGGIKLKLDLVIGETSEIESNDKDKLQDIASRIRDLHHRLNDIRREQVFQRVGRTSTNKTMFLANIVNQGTRGRIQRSVRIYQWPCHPLDHHPTRRPRPHLCLATLESEVLLHQAEAYIKPSFSGSWFFLKLATFAQRGEGGACMS